MTNRRTEPDLPPGPATELVELFKELQSRGPKTVKQLANQTGLSSSHISEVQRGIKAPSPKAAAEIAKALGAPPEGQRRAFDIASALIELNRYHNRMAAVTPPGPHRPADTPAASRIQSRTVHHGRWIAALASAAVLVSTVIVIGLEALWTAHGNVSEISGSVECESGRPVVGVWIAAATGQKDSGLAHLGTDRAIPGPATGAIVTYSYLLPHGGAYNVHVGCGGVASHWYSSNYSASISARIAHLRCDDPANGPNSTGTCTLEKSSVRNS